ncbi:FAD dependent oxidoreductase [Prosthecobacter fusiformis]|uniref:FAD dependent oxidoreductase n=1 Tax=Prosthecobacter fusiformis TaxID=48464 RepID=A0A4R7SST7_9BACT|nr:FAD-dependent oxidoreductase [Prosthecobacter fusiformis]TDU81749.1 FAD dependent oxidoreductase [Prosthecobacter fusiformis]
MRTLLFSLFALAPFLCAQETDLVIYGGTPAGISAGITAAREGASVVIIEPTQWIGGMVTGGLSRTDVGKEKTIGGFPREFFTRAAAAKPETNMWYAEPKVNLVTYEAMLKEAGVKFITAQSLKSITKEGTRITSLTTSDGTTYTGKMFVDASYEGDLMAAAKVSYIVGRESRAQYGEPLAGYYPMPIRPRTVEVMESDCPSIGGTGPSYIHGTPVSIPALDAAGKPIFGVYADPKLEPGSADGLTQAYNFRITVTQRPDIFVPFPKPASYDPAKYELLLRLIQAFPGIRFGRIFHIGSTSHGKYDLNAQGLFSTDYPGGNTEYPDGDAATRAAIWQDHVDFIQGMLWFLGHDERVPQSLRDQANSWGLCKDEYTDNNHWPYALYIREGRRMIGEYVMIQNDLQGDIFKDDSIAMGSFLIDCHIVQRIVAEDGTVRDEGSFPDDPAMPYQIAYRSLTPKRAECENLLVPVCFSASHIAYCSMRMEPVYMAMGQAAGLASVMAVKGETSVQGIDVPALRKKLLEQNAVIELGEMASMIRSSKLPGIAQDDKAAETTGKWTSSSYGTPVDGFSLNDGNANKGQMSVVYTLKVPTDGRYEVRVSYVTATNRASNVPVTIQHSEGSETVLVNQKQQPAIDSLFTSLGTFNFSADKPAIITITNKDTDGIVGADAVQLLKQ